MQLVLIVFCWTRAFSWFLLFTIFDMVLVLKLFLTTFSILLITVYIQQCAAVFMSLVSFLSNLLSENCSVKVTARRQTL